MSILDLRTVIFLEVVTVGICALVLTALWLQNRARFAGLGLWVLNFVLQTLGLSAFMFRGVIPDWISIIVANVFVLSATMLGYQGLERFFGKRRPQHFHVALLLVFALVHGYLTYGHPSLWARTLNIAFAILVVCGRTLWLLLRRIDAPMRPLTHWVRAVYGGYCLIFAVRIALFLVRGGPDDYFMSGLSEALFHIVFQVQFIFLTYAMTLMVNQRLLDELSFQEQKYFKAFHSSPYGLVLSRMEDGVIVEANTWFSKMMGYDGAEIVGKTSCELGLWPQREEREAMITELKAKGLIEGRERRYTRKTGETITALYSAELFPFGGETLVLASLADISARKRAEEEREKLVSEREHVLSALKVLNGLLPICASCKKIRDDGGYWNQLEDYITQHSEADFSHSLCPECMAALYPEEAEEGKEAVAAG